MYINALLIKLLYMLCWDWFVCRLWGFEKLVFSMHWKNNRPEAHKYAVQGRKIWVTEIHNTVHMKGGKRRNVGYDRIWFHHFHGTLTTRGEVCTQFEKAAQYLDWFATPISFENANYSADYTLAQLGSAVKEFELETIGEQPFILWGATKMFFHSTLRLVES